LEVNIEVFNKNNLMIIASLLFSLLIIACFGGESKIANEAKPISNAELPNLITTDESTKLPLIKIIDSIGNEVVFESPPLQIATISPTTTELLYASGGSSILRDRASRYPEQAKSLPNVGSAYNPSIEAIVAANPDLVIIEALTQARFAPILIRHGLRVMAIKVESLDDLKKNILILGKIIGKETIAKNKVLEIENRLHNAKHSDGQSVLMLISDQERNLYAATAKSYTGLIAKTSGMINLASDLSDSGPYPGFAMVSPEFILKANPDVIITISPAPDPAPKLSETISHIPPFAALKAMQTNNIIEGDLALFLQAPGPRIVEAVEFLNTKLDSKEK